MIISGKLFDFKKPDYTAIIQARLKRAASLRGNPAKIETLREYYATDIVAFINDWGVTVDPRNATRKDKHGNRALVQMPFVLFPRQEEAIHFLEGRLAAEEPGLIDKSRDMGMTWLMGAWAVARATLVPEQTIGFGSRKLHLVDKAGDPSCIFWKLEEFAMNLPKSFRGGFTRKHHTSLLLKFPDTGSSIIGEGGDNIGRGGRTTAYVIDESAFLERPGLVDASLSANTNCRIDLSSVNGMDNPFAEKRHAWPDERIFTFHWRSDPRKDDEWYAKQKSELNPLVVAQEIDLNYNASKSGIVCPHEWVVAAIDAAEKLGIEPSGERIGALDVADEGRDLNCWGGRHGIELFHLEPWSGVGSDIYETTEKAFAKASMYMTGRVRYDTDGLGSGVRGDARTINALRAAEKLRQINFEPFRGSGEVIDPDGQAVEGGDGFPSRTNKDFFANRKAQAWWSLRNRLLNTFRAVNGKNYDPDFLISFSTAKLGQAELTRLVHELVQPVYKINGTGKVLIDKAPDDTRSPNRADTVMMLYAPETAESVSILDLLSKS